MKYDRCMQQTAWKYVKFVFIYKDTRNSTSKTHEEYNYFYSYK